MNIESIREYCLSKKGANEGFPFDEDTLVFKVFDKMFAILDLKEGKRVLVKCDADRAVELREQYAAVEPAYHCNKRYWNQLWFEQLDEKLVKELIDHSYDEVLKKMTRKQRRALEEMPDENEAKS